MKRKKNKYFKTVDFYHRDNFLKKTTVKYL